MTILQNPATLHNLAERHHAGQSRVELVSDTQSTIVADDNRAIIEINPDALHLAQLSDARWQSGTQRSPLDGIPIAIKDNIDTGDRMHTTAGSAALLSSRPAGDAFLMKKLRAAGIIPIAKANMSEWANFRANRSSSGYSTRGGQCTNPHDPIRCPSGSSSGSAAAVAAGLVSVALGDRWINYFTFGALWRGRHQAERRVGQQEWRHPNLAESRYGGHTCQHGGRCRQSTRNHRWERPK